MMTKKFNYDKLVDSIRNKGIKVFLAPPEKGEGNHLTQTSIRYMVERNLDKIKNDAIAVNNFGEIVDHINVALKKH